MLIGTFCTLSERLVAVTMMSAGPLSTTGGAGGASCACTGLIASGDTDANSASAAPFTSLRAPTGCPADKVLTIMRAPCH
jgi:hypothetical protein